MVPEEGVDEAPVHMASWYSVVDRSDDDRSERKHCNGDKNALVGIFYQTESLPGKHCRKRQDSYIFLFTWRTAYRQAESIE